MDTTNLVSGFVRIVEVTEVEDLVDVVGRAGFSRGTLEPGNFLSDRKFQNEFMQFSKEMYFNQFTLYGFLRELIT